MAIEIVELSIALFFLWAFTYYCYRDYRLDMYRQELFIIRGELFEFAATGCVKFSSPEYTILRNFINQLIRYAHTITMSRFIMGYALNTLNPPRARNVIDEWKDVVAKIGSAQVRNDLNAFHNRIAQTIMGQIIKRSALLFSGAILLTLVLKLVGSRKKPGEGMIKTEDIERFESQVIESERQEPISELVTA